MSIEFFTLGSTALQIFKVGEQNAQKAKRIVYGQATSNSNALLHSISLIMD